MTRPVDPPRDQPYRSDHWLSTRQHPSLPGPTKRNTAPINHLSLGIFFPPPPQFQSQVALMRWRFQWKTRWTVGPNQNPAETFQTFFFSCQTLENQTFHYLGEEFGVETATRKANRRPARQQSRRHPQETSKWNALLLCFLERKRERERPKKKIKGGSDDHVPVTVFPERRTPQNDEPKSKKKKRSKNGRTKTMCLKTFRFSHSSLPWRREVFPSSIWIEYFK